jgi:hypothetical protein
VNLNQEAEEYTKRRIERLKEFLGEENFNKVFPDGKVPSKGIAQAWLDGYNQGFSHAEFLNSGVNDE